MRRIVALSLFAVSFLVVACNRKVPSDLQSTLDSVKPEARKIAAVAAKQCAAMFVNAKVSPDPLPCMPTEQSRVIDFIRVPGAKASPLATNATVEDVKFECHMPSKVMHGTCTLHLLSMKEVTEKPDDIGQHGDVVEGNCNESPTNCEQATVPSFYVPSRDSVDYHIIVPVADGSPPGSFVDAVVVLRNSK